MNENENGVLLDTNHWIVLVLAGKPTKLDPKMAVFIGMQLIAAAKFSERAQVTSDLDDLIEEMVHRPNGV